MKFAIVQTVDNDIQTKDFTLFTVFQLMNNGKTIFSTEDIRVLQLISKSSQACEKWIIDADRNSMELGELQSLKLIKSYEKLTLECRYSIHSDFITLFSIDFEDFKRAVLNCTVKT